MPFTLLGSFPNSQIRPRAATENENFPNVELTADTVETILAQDNNRTVLTILNEPTSAAAVRIRSADEGDPSADDGFLLQPGASLNLETQEEVKGFAIGAAAKLSLKNGVG